MEDLLKQLENIEQLKVEIESELNDDADRNSDSTLSLVLKESPCSPDEACSSSHQCTQDEDPISEFSDVKPSILLGSPMSNEYNSTDFNFISPMGLVWKYLTIAKTEDEIENFRIQNQVLKHTVRMDLINFRCQRFKAKAKTKCDFKMLSRKLVDGSFGIYYRGEHNHPVVPLLDHPSRPSSKIAATKNKKITKQLIKKSARIVIKKELSDAKEASQPNAESLRTLPRQTKLPWTLVANIHSDEQLQEIRKDHQVVVQNRKNSNTRFKCNQWRSKKSGCKYTMLLVKGKNQNPDQLYEAYEHNHPLVSLSNKSDALFNKPKDYIPIPWNFVCFINNDEALEKVRIAHHAIRRYTRGEKTDFSCSRKYMENGCKYRMQLVKGGKDAPDELYEAFEHNHPIEPEPSSKGPNIGDYNCWAFVSQIHTDEELLEIRMANQVYPDRILETKTTFICNKRKHGCKFKMMLTTEANSVRELYKTNEHNHPVVPLDPTKINRKTSLYYEKRRKSILGANVSRSLDYSSTSSINNTSDVPTTSKRSLSSRHSCASYSSADNESEGPVAKIPRKQNSISPSPANTSTESVPKGNQKSGEFDFLCKLNDRNELDEHCASNMLIKVGSKVGQRNYRCNKHESLKCQYKVVAKQSKSGKFKVYESGHHNHNLELKLPSRSPSVQEIFEDEIDPPGPSNKSPQIEVKNASVKCQPTMVNSDQKLGGNNFIDTRGFEWTPICEFDRESELRQTCRANGVIFRSSSQCKTKRYYYCPHNRTSSGKANCPYEVFSLKEKEGVYKLFQKGEHNHRPAKQISSKESKVNRAKVTTPELIMINEKENPEEDQPTEPDIIPEAVQQNLSVNDMNSFSLMDHRSDLEKIGAELRLTVIAGKKDTLSFLSNEDPKFAGKSLIFEDKGDNIEVSEFNVSHFEEVENWPKAAGLKQFLRAVRGKCSEFFKSEQ